MTLNYLAIDVEITDIALKDKPQAMLDASPKGTVPVLLVNDANHTVIDESLDIMRWAVQRLQTLQQDWSESALQHPLIKANDNEFKSWLDKYKYHVRFPEQSQEDYLQQALVFIEILERQLVFNSSIGSYFLSKGDIGREQNREGFSIIDVAIFPFVRQFAYVDVERFNQLPYTKVQQWLTFMLQTDCFNSVMKKRPLYSDAEYKVEYK